MFRPEPRKNLGPALWTSTIPSPFARSTRRSVNNFKKLSTIRLVIQFFITKHNIICIYYLQHVATSAMDMLVNFYVPETQTTIIYDYFAEYNG